MTRTAITALCLFFVMLAPLPAESPSEYEMYWPQWRGPSGNGVAASSDPPVEWSESKNVKWKTAIPGKGSSSPIIWGDSIFVTSAVPTGVGEETGVKHQFVVFAIKRQNGEPSWRTTVRTEIPHEGTHRTGTWASNSAVTDGEHVYAYFGSRGLYSLDMSGNVKWERDFGDMHKRNSFGEGSSPALHGNRILVQWDQEGPSFLVALDRATGEEIWRIDRNEPSSWSTPRVVEHDGVEQVLTAASNRVRSYDLKDGSLIWECEGLGANVIPAPVVVDDTPPIPLRLCCMVKASIFLKETRRFSRRLTPRRALPLGMYIRLQSGPMEESTSQIATGIRWLSDTVLSLKSWRQTLSMTVLTHRQRSLTTKSFCVGRNISIALVNNAYESVLPKPQRLVKREAAGDSKGPELLRSSR
jgi:hypothetical protein